MEYWGEPELISVLHTEMCVLPAAQQQYEK